MKKLMILFAATALTLMPSMASAARVFVGVRPAFGYGPAFYPGYWGAGYWGPGYYSPVYGYPATGEVKIDTKSKDAQVFINGAFAGYTKDAKNLHLRPGSYTVEVRQPNGQPALSEKVFVTAGKTVHLHPEI